MAKNGEPQLTSSDISSIIHSSNELVASVDPTHFEAESKLASIKQKLAADEATRQERVDKRLETVRENAKKNSPLYIVDVG